MQKVVSRIIDYEMEERVAKLYPLLFLRKYILKNRRDNKLKYIMNCEKIIDETFFKQNIERRLTTQKTFRGLFKFYLTI